MTSINPIIICISVGAILMLAPIFGLSFVDKDIEEIDLTTTSYPNILPFIALLVIGTVFIIALVSRGEDEEDKRGISRLTDIEQ